MPTAAASTYFHGRQFRIFPNVLLPVKFSFGVFNNGRNIITPDASQICDIIVVLNGLVHSKIDSGIGSEIRSVSGGRNDRYWNFLQLHLASDICRLSTIGIDNSMCFWIQALPACTLATVCGDWTEFLSASPSPATHMHALTKRS